MEWIRNLINLLLNLPHSFGAFGLFLYCLVGLLIYMPIGPDIFLIASSISCKCLPISKVIATLTAYFIGCTIDFAIGRWFGYRIKWQVLQRLKGLGERYGGWAMFVAGLTPIPLREASIAAGVLRMRYKDFILPLFSALALRFFVEGSLGIWF